MPMMTQWRRALVRCALLALFVAAFASVALDSSYVAYPRTPDPSIGRIAPYEVKGVVVYVTEGQRAVVSLL
jgi:hypothetical protein